MNWLRKRFVALFFKHLAIAVRDARIPIVNRFFDMANEMSLTEDLNAVGSEFNWPVSNGTAMKRLQELCNAHLGEYGPMVWSAIKVFQEQFNRPSE